MGYCCAPLINKYLFFIAILVAMYNAHNLIYIISHNI